jgi:hypothetical protein
MAQVTEENGVVGGSKSLGSWRRPPGRSDTAAPWGGGGGVCRASSTEEASMGGELLEGQRCGGGLAAFEGRDGHGVPEASRCVRTTRMGRVVAVVSH